MVIKEEYVCKFEWLKIKLNINENYIGLKKMMCEKNFYIVCEEVRCLNIYECWVVCCMVIFMILGEVCICVCCFCVVKIGLLIELDLEESECVVDFVQLMNLKYVVIIVVVCDDLKDGGVSVLVEIICVICCKNLFIIIEVLFFDMGGVEENLCIVMDVCFDILNYNIEIVCSFMFCVCVCVKYECFFEFFCCVKEMQLDIFIKLSIMFGLGEIKEEIIEMMDDLCVNNVDIMMLG